jgi:hypothetical protein
VATFEWSHTPVYEPLHTDEPAEPDAIEIRRELERTGIEMNELAADFISHQTPYRRFTNCLGGSKSNEESPEDRRKEARDRVYALQRRTELVTESTVESLQSVGVTDLGDPDVLVDIQLVCRDCGQSMDLDSVLTDGCECPSS